MLKHGPEVCQGFAAQGILDQRFQLVDHLIGAIQRRHLQKHLARRSSQANPVSQFLDGNHILGIDQAGQFLGDFGIESPFGNQALEEIDLADRHLQVLDPDRLGRLDRHGDDLGIGRR